MFDASALTSPPRFQQRRQDRWSGGKSGSAPVTPPGRTGRTARPRVDMVDRSGDGVRQALIYARRARPRFLAELGEFIRFPSVSAQPRHAGDVRRCAAWLAGQLRTIGMEHVELVHTGRHPIVAADWLHAPGQSTVLIYGHYDVQPADPLGEWRSPPFEPEIRAGYLYGRGAADDKGQMFAHVKALESCLRATTGRLPINVRCVFEGEEEAGSRGLAAFLACAGRGQADVAVMSDMWMAGAGRPAIAESLRGALSVEIAVSGQVRDLHSGNFGGAIHNPLQALCEIVARLHDARGVIAIPGFHTRVRALPAEARAYMRRVGSTDAQILRAAGARCGWGEAGYTLYERTTIRPALSINGITGGYQGSGAKAVIPAHATAKLNFRLVPDQDPAEIDALLRRHVARIAPPTVEVKLRTLFRAKPFVLQRDHPAVRAACAALRKGFGAEAEFLRIGGTIPVAHLLQDELGIATVPLGFALPDDGLHAPNERFRVANFFQAVDTAIHLLGELATAGGAARRNRGSGRHPKSDELPRQITGDNRR